MAAGATAGSAAARGHALPADRFFDLDLALTPSAHNLPAAAAAAPSPAVHLTPAALPAAAASSAVCAVCMERCGDGGKQTPCGHVFHGLCISTWLVLRDSCPLCRRRVLSAA